MLHVPLALYCSPDIFMPFGINEPLKPILPREAVRHSLAMFPHSAVEAAGHADIERSVRSVCHHVNPPTGHKP
jgi:hypothetical protein